jgi:hypothetical protein
MLRAAVAKDVTLSGVDAEGADPGAGWSAAAFLFGSIDGAGASLASELSGVENLMAPFRCRSRWPTQVRPRIGPATPPRAREIDKEEERARGTALRQAFKVRGA